MKRIISVWVENKFGALNRVATMFSGRGFNIHSISIGVTDDPDVSRMTIVTSGDDKILDQIIKQLNRLIDTIKVVDLSAEKFVARELALISVSYTKSTRSEILDLVEIFQGKVVDITHKILTMEVSGPPEKIEALINLCIQYGIREIARSGLVAIKREEQEVHRVAKEVLMS
ncbi:MAG: acetolactate synthase small subunit [Bacteroidetes bacterium]|nr:acetolactate synthase small subunit [Bacteroidota bacterium]